MHAGRVRFHRSGLVVIDQEDERETNERGNSRGRSNQVEYESYGSDDESEVPTESSAQAIKKLTKKSKKI